MTARDLALSCRCGTVTGQLIGITPKRGTLCRCYCTDCRAFARHIGNIESHDAHGGIEVYQTLPGRVEFTSGQDQLCALQMKPGSLLRFYAGCCGTQFGNMLPHDRIRFLGVPLTAFAAPVDRAALGPVLMVHRAKEGLGDVPERSFGYKTARNRAFFRHLGSMFGFGPKGLPYFNAGAPIAEPHVLTDAERRAAYHDG